MDHWSKLHVLFALCQTSAAEEALNLQNQVFSYLPVGTPKILHYDNGCELVNETGQFAQGMAWGSHYCQPKKSKCQPKCQPGSAMGQWRKYRVCVSLNLTQILLLGQKGFPLFCVSCSIANMYAILTWAYMGICVHSVFSCAWMVVLH